MPPVAKSKSAKRRANQNRHAQHNAQRRAQRSKSHAHTHLPKVGTKADDAYLRRRRQADLVDFGLVHRRRRRNRILSVMLIALALAAMAAFIVLTR